MLNHGVAALTNIDDETVVDVWADILVLCGHSREREQAVELCKHVRIQLHLRHPFAERQHQLLIEPVLDDLDTLFRGLYLLFVLLELVGYIAFGIDECLLADPLRRYLFLVGVTHLEVVSEDIVIADLQAGDARALYLALLDLQQVLLAVCLDSAQFVELCVHTSCDDARAALRCRRIRHYLLLDAHSHLCARIELFAE